MSIIVLTDEQVKEMQESNFRFVEPGFVVDLGSSCSHDAKHALVKEKDEVNEALHVVPLTQENVFLLLKGKTPPVVSVRKTDVLNVFATAVTDAMCREREGLQAHCFFCKQRVFKWKSENQDTQNYHVGQDGLCRHNDCPDTSKSKPSL